VAAPSGTFIAKVRAGAIQFPAPLNQYCVASEWTLFRVLPVDGDRLEIQPVLPGDEVDDVTSPYHSSLSGDGKLWIPAALREMVSLGEQSVMMRVESGAITIYLRKVFETLGFRP